VAFGLSGNPHTAASLPLSRDTSPLAIG
jgi:hypothetical protein